MDENMDELYFECCHQMLFFREIEQNNMVETIYVVFFYTNPQLKC
jgi:hypothetical protein